MKRRLKIEEAIAIAKERDPACLVCGSPYIDGAHLLPRNNPTPGNDPTNADGIMSLCRFHHREYDFCKRTETRITWLRRHNLIHQLRYLEGLLNAID